MKEKIIFISPVPTSQHLSAAHITTTTNSLPCTCHILVRCITILQRIKINTPACLHRAVFCENNTQKTVWMKAKQKNQFLSFIAITLLWSNINIKDNLIIFSTTKRFLKSLSRADAEADLSLRWAHMPFRWFCHEAAHKAMMDSFRQQFYPRMRQAGRDRKSLTAIERDILVPCVRLVYHR